jgi:DNA polymerase III epsilon subunit-like protein
MNNDNEFYISVDIESAGPSPAFYSMLSIGACTLQKPRSSFYIELKPVHEKKNQEALKISGLDWHKLVEEGIHPQKAMSEFAQWIADVTPKGCEPVCVAFNAVYDWLFINEYFFRFFGSNPFGHKALDIKTYYMGLHGVTWEETAMRYLSTNYLDNQGLTHNALQDALDQAEIFQKMLQEAKDKSKGEVI